MWPHCKPLLRQHVHCKLTEPEHHTPLSVIRQRLRCPEASHPHQCCVIVHLSTSNTNRESHWRGSVLDYIWETQHMLSPKPLRRVIMCNEIAQALRRAIVKKDCKFAPENTFFTAHHLLTSCKGSVLRIPVWEMLKSSNPLWLGCWYDIFL